MNDYPNSFDTDMQETMNLAAQLRSRIESLNHRMIDAARNHESNEMSIAGGKRNRDESDNPVIAAAMLSAFGSAKSELKSLARDARNLEIAVGESGRHKWDSIIK